MPGWSHTLVDATIVLVLIGGIWQFRSPRRARSGNLTAALALLLALVAVVYRQRILEPAVVVPVLVAGSLVGWVVATRVTMIQIPAMVAFQHGAGGVAAFLISFVELTRHSAPLTMAGTVSGLLGLIIGAATFSGSLVAGGKLANRLRQTPTALPRHTWLLGGVIATIVALAIAAEGVAGSAIAYPLLALILLSIVLGVVFSMRIGGADMPVLISFLNATAGLAAALCGIVIENRLLIVSGATVAASGSILTHVMCTAMNRSLLGVFVGGRPSVGRSSAPGVAAFARSPLIDASLPMAAGADAVALEPREPMTRAIAAARQAQRIIIIPGYGMALAQAQFAVVRLAQELEREGKTVKFAIHPVAGRMPGHMHVLLAEAEADYDRLYEMDDINAEFRDTDLALIVGACDVVNPAAIAAEGTPISGMPILLAHEAKQVVVCNLDERPGYSGVQNPLYADPRTILLFGDAQATMNRLLSGLAEVGDRQEAEHQPAGRAPG